MALRVALLIPLVLAGCGAAKPPAQPFGTTAPPAATDDDEGEELPGVPQPAGVDHTKTAVRCNKLYRGVKTGTDPGAAAIDLENPKRKTVQSLGALPRPDHRSDERVDPVETTAVVIVGTVTSYTIESNDGDYHLVVDDGAGNKIIVEAADPRCVTGSPWKQRIAAVRRAVEQQFPDAVVGRFKDASVPVAVVGPPFFDKKHGVKDAAPNFIEIHPIVGICFEKGCRP